MSQETSETASMNDQERVQASPSEQPGPGLNHGEIKSKRPSSFEQVSGNRASKRVRKEIGDTDEIESAIRESKLQHENEQLKQQLNFEKQQISKLIDEYERKLYTQKRDYEAQVHALKEKISLIEETGNRGELDKAQTESAQKGVQRPNKSTPEESGQVKADVVSQKQDAWTRLESRCLKSFLKKRPDLDNESVIELTTLQDEEDTYWGEDSDEDALEEFGVDTEDMDEDEYSSFTYLRKIFKRLNNKVAENAEEREKQSDSCETLALCMENVKERLDPVEDNYLGFIRDTIRSYERADKLLAENPRKKLAKFSLSKIAEAKSTLELVKDELTTKFCVRFKDKMKIVQACRKMGEPEATSSIDKFAQYVDLLEKDMEAFWSKSECARSISEVERALDLIERVEKVVRGQ
ncbi:hypothetical protein OXX80_006816 [Metschnikowia pulcherrima]